MGIFSSHRKVTVVIPIYKSSLSPHEDAALKRCCKMLGNHAITLVKPLSLSVESYSKYHPDFIIESFDDSYFEDISGYNRLMLSSIFYERFLSYDYILIHQLDAFVFKDELKYWCKKGYDYIGAPWLVSPFQGNAKEQKEHLKELENVYKFNIKQENSHLPLDAQFANKVGNGGFSLRKVKKFYRICLRDQQMINYYNENNKHHFFNEDVFWALEVNRKKNRLKIPSYKKAVCFSIEFMPEYAFELTKGQLPFACHGWDLFPEFWRDILGQFDFII